MEKISMADLRGMLAECRGKLDACFLHWTAGRYGQYFDDYHILIDHDGSIYAPSRNLLITRRHTWQRNSDALGIAMCCCYKAEAGRTGLDCDFGDYPPTAKQIEVMSIVVAMVNKYAGLDFNKILTHCEIAFVDGYGPFSGDEETRWDLWYLPDSAWGNKMRGGGEVLRGKAIWYLQNVNV